MVLNLLDRKGAVFRWSHSKDSASPRCKESCGTRFCCSLQGNLLVAVHRLTVITELGKTQPICVSRLEISAGSQSKGRTMSRMLGMLNIDLIFSDFGQAA